MLQLLFLLGAILPATLLGQVITEFPVLPVLSDPQDIVAGPDGALWFTERGTEKIGRITTAGVVTEFPIPTANANPDGIAVGSDGALWFSEYGRTKIGRITTAGIITEFPLPADFSNPIGMAAGPDGALWFGGFSNSGAGLIGRITTAGAVATFGVPTQYANAIVAGSDGALWFTEYSGNKIGRITTAGSVTEFAIPTPNSHPGGITGGPDGALWFTELDGNKIGRITTAGALTEFPVPTASSLPNRIAAGPDGALWFTELAGRIGRGTTEGVITEFPFATGSHVLAGITAGPDGALWFTEGSVNPRIGRITTSSGNPSLTISKAAASSVTSGQNLTYTITYGNTGSGNATGVVINDTVPAGTTFVSATGGGAVASGVVTWNIGTLNAGVTGQTVTFTVMVTAASGSVTNSAYSIQASGVSPVSAAPVSTTVTPAGAAALTISKAAEASVVSGQNLTYTIIYGNGGTAAASGVVIRDTVPAGATFVSATGGGTVSAGVVSWNVGNLNAGVTGQTVTFTVNVTAASGSLTNSVYSIQANGVSPVSGSPVSTAVTSAAAAPTTVGNLVANPNASDAFLFPIPYTDVDLASPATFAGSLTTATFGWSALGCAQALKLKFFRPSGDNLVFVAERGPFDSSPSTVALSPPVSVQPGDLIGISHLTNCGNPVGAFPGAAAGYVAFAGDVASTVAISAGKATPNFTLAVQASGTASESVQGIVAVVASIPGVPPSLFKTGFQMHNSTDATLTGRLVFHPQGVAGSGADPSLAYSLAPGATQSFDDLLPGMRLSGPRIGSLDIVTPVGTPAPVVAARVYNDGGAAGTTGFTMSAASPDAILAAGDHGVLFAPADLARFRMNIGVRTGPSGAAMVVTRRDAAGTGVQTINRTYGPNFFEQISAVEFLAGAPFGANDTITIRVDSGSAIAYAVNADNSTQDPSIQFASKAP